LCSAVTIAILEYVVVVLLENVVQVFRPAELSRPEGLHYDLAESGEEPFMIIAG